MISGIFRTLHERGEYDITVRIKETEKAYTFELIENNSRFSPAHLDMMFSKAKRISVKKEKSPHYIEFFNDGENFVIYPYRAGIPFLFEIVVDNKQ